MRQADDKLAVAVAGASGRMGRMVIRAVLEAPDMRLTGALTAPGEPWVGGDAGALAGREPLGISVTADPQEAFEGAEVVIDFSTPAAVSAFLPAIRTSRAALVSGTTALDSDQFAALEALSTELPVLWAPNLSVGANLIRHLARQAATRLGPGYDLEVLDIHHRHKHDAPSGTALGIAQAVSDARGEPDPDIVLRRRGIIGPRGGVEQVGVGVLRGGNVVGEHTIFFFGDGERIEIAHKVTDRMAFALGAIRAARWLVGQEPALYTVDDVLGFNIA